MQGHPIGRARAALRALHRAQRSGELESDIESNVARSGNLEVCPRNALYPLLVPQNILSDKRATTLKSTSPCCCLCACKFGEEQPGIETCCHLVFSIDLVGIDVSSLLNKLQGDIFCCCRMRCSTQIRRPGICTKEQMEKQQRLKVPRFLCDSMRSYGTFTTGGHLSRSIYWHWCGPHYPSEDAVATSSNIHCRAES